MSSERPGLRSRSSGLCVVDKPTGMTSHDVVARLRRIVGTRKVGHAGTLDPMATGVLVVGVESATRLLGYICADSKCYNATIRLGQSTGTDDADGDVLTTTSAVHLTETQIRAAMVPLVGEIDQIPSSVSAIKLDGKRAYQRVRAGEQVEIPARRVTVTRFDMLGIKTAGGQPSTDSEVGDSEVGDVIDVDIEVECSAGTYIRALARDVGSALNVGGHLVSLRRTRVGRFDISQACSLEELAGLERPVMIDLTAAVATQFPRRDLDSSQAATLRHGVPLSGVGIAGPYGAFDPNGEVVALLSETGTAAADSADGAARPLIVFPAA